MEGRFRIRSGNPFRAEFEETNGASRTPDPGDLAESPPPTGAFTDAMKLPSTSSPKRSKRSLQKRVISIPIKDSEGSRLRGEGAPPPDSWAWRKYGQKPIKGSPYPRGYYRCSSSKGCPARKQVERSRDDPTVLVITYSCEHNHPLPAPRNSHHQHHSHQNKAAAVAGGAMDDALIEAETDISTPDLEQERDREPEPETDPEPAGKFTDVKDEALLMPADDECFGWFSGMEMTTASFLERPFLDSKIAVADTDMALLFPMKDEEDESLFADLGELPECSVVFRHRDVGTQVQIC